MKTDEEVDESIDYLKQVNQRAAIRRIFMQGADAFVLSYDRLMRLGEKLHEALPSLETIGGYGRMSDLCNKTVEQLRTLHEEQGYENVHFGVESADGDLLKLVNKGYDEELLWEQGQKIHESGMPWTAGYMLGLGGHDYPDTHPLKSAKFFSATVPSRLGIVSTTYVRDRYTHFIPPMFIDVKEGRFVETGELERYRELRKLVEHLECETMLDGRHSTMPYYISGRIPQDRQKILADIDTVFEQADEEQMGYFRHYVVAEV